jgi:aminoglycoside phosphotransferase (APT) family kinase protein
MAREWAAEFAVTDDLARRLIETQFPTLAPIQMELLGAGYDNSAYEVNGEWVFRFPRRPMGVDLINVEIRVLPGLQEHLPLAIPAPTLAGRESEEFPYPFAGYQKIPGETGDRAGLSDEDRLRAAPVLGRFLRALHDAPVDPGVDAPEDTIRRSDMGYRVPWLRGRLERSAHLHDAGTVARVSEFLEIPEVSEAFEPEVWVHGDLYSRHLVFTDCQLAGVIDWGDVHLGDPALDLSIAYSFLPSEAREAFWAEYGEVDRATHWRARFKALLYGVILVEYGTDVADEAIVKAGRRALSLSL